MRPLFFALVPVGLVAASSAWAQTAPSGSPGTAPALPAGSVGGTVTGAPLERTGSTTAVGKTKPPGDPVGPGLGTRPDLERKSRDLDRKIDKGICVGCK